MNKIESITQTEEMFKRKREAANDKARANYDRACEDASFSENEREIRVQQFALGRAMYSGENLENEKEKLNALYKKRLELLAVLGMDKSQLIPQYECSVCKDTGTAEGKRCKCFNNALFELLAESSFLKEKCDLNNVKAVSENNQKVLNFLKKFEKDFPYAAKKNILLSGKTGTGKTFLLSALATEILKKGCSVFFITAFNLNRLMLKIHVGSLAEKDQILASILDADVLIVDDLGSEQIYKNVTLEYLFNIINERQLADKYTFYTTNCNLEELQNRYGERIFSRLVNKKNTTLWQLDSEDQRLKNNV